MPKDNITQQILFTAQVEKSEGKGGWHYVLLPEPVRDQLKSQSGKNGNVPVLVTIGQTTYSSTTMSMGQQRWFVAINASVRKAESISNNDVAHIAITPDWTRLKTDEFGR